MCELTRLREENKKLRIAILDLETFPVLCTSVRVNSAFKRMNVRRVADVLMFSAYEYLHVPYFGIRSLKDLEESLDNIGFKLPYSGIEAPDVYHPRYFGDGIPHITNDRGSQYSFVLLRDLEENKP
jgi:hypothetical protein